MWKFPHFRWIKKTPPLKKKCGTGLNPPPLCGNFTLFLNPSLIHSTVSGQNSQLHSSKEQLVWTLTLSNKLSHLYKVFLHFSQFVSIKIGIFMWFPDQPHDIIVQMQVGVDGVTATMALTPAAGQIFMRILASGVFWAFLVTFTTILWSVRFE